MNATLEAAPKCTISPDGTQILMGDWTNFNGSVSGDPRKNFSAI